MRLPIDNEELSRSQIGCCSSSSSLQSARYVNGANESTSPTRVMGWVSPELVDETEGQSLGKSLLLTVEEAAALLRIGRTTAYELIMGGRIQSVRIGRRRLVVRDGLQKFVSELVASQRGD
jgi:excisionase family DNA binding protein